MLNEMINPDLYHKKLPWNLFEGWYFKVCDHNNSFAFIPGIFHGTKSMPPHAFIQVLNGRTCEFEYIMFPVKDFSFITKPFSISIANNTFSLEGFTLDINSKFGKITANIHFSNQSKWGTNYSKNRSMGYYNFVPFMECYSQVCLIDASANGSISFGTNNAIFNCAKAYSEKNWGNQFPMSWIWVQSNLFDTNSVSLSASIGHIPMPIGSFRGFLIGLKINCNFYEFTSMNGSTLEIKRIHDNLGNSKDVILTVTKKNLILTLKTTSSSDQFTLLTGPKDGKMQPLVKESIISTVFVKLVDAKNQQIIYEGVGSSAGIEFGGSEMSD